MSPIWNPINLKPTRANAFKKNHHMSHHWSYWWSTQLIHPPINRSTISNPPLTDPSPPIQTQLANPRPTTHFSHNPPQPRPKHRTQPRPTTPLSTDHSPQKKKKRNRHSDPRQKPQPPLTHAVTHDPNTEPNREGRERRDGVWVWREKREESREGRERKELKYWVSGERNFEGGIKYIYIYIYFFFLEYCYSTILTLEL